MDYLLREDPVEGEAMKTTGIDWGPKGIVLVYRHSALSVPVLFDPSDQKIKLGDFSGGDFGVVKMPGHSAWTDNFSPWHYEPTKYAIIEIKKFAEGKKDSHWGRFDLLYKTEIAPGHAWRRAVKELKDLACNMAEGTPVTVPIERRP